MLFNPLTICIQCVPASYSLRNRSIVLYSKVCDNKINKNILFFFLINHNQAKLNKIVIKVAPISSRYSVFKGARKIAQNYHKTLIRKWNSLNYRKINKKSVEGYFYEMDQLSLCSIFAFQNSSVKFVMVKL